MLCVIGIVEETVFHIALCDGVYAVCIELLEIKLQSFSKSGPSIHEARECDSVGAAG